MKLFTLVLWLLFSIVIFADSASSQQGPSRICITDVTIISPENLDHIAEGNVLVENGRIVSVERGKATKKPADAAMVSGKGQFLIPGLIDSHVHLAAIPGMQFESSFDPNAAKPAMVTEYFQQLPRSYLYFGYTTLIDLAVIDRRALEDFRQASLHPDLYDCGQSLPIANGYPMSFAPPTVRFKLFPNFIYDPKQAPSIPPEYRPEDHSAAAAVARVKNSGGICVKTYFERGFGRERNLPVISADTIAEIRKDATQAGLVLMMHANSLEAQKFAVDGDVDVIAHGMWNWGDLRNPSELPAEIKSLLDRIVDNRIGYQPTIQVMGGLRAYFDPQYLTLQTIPKVIPAEMLEWFNSPQGKWFKKEISDDDTPDAAVLEGFDGGPLRRVRQVVSYLASKDANFLFGTDTPSAPTYGNLPGLNGYLEMQQLKKAGLSLEQIFRAATINNARKFKIDSQVGTIEPGKIANLVLLKKSPLESVDAYDSIVTIWVHGKQVSRASLAASADK
ncbi:MAG: amidohydrolase family protein [Candidatus Sulfotelmatobacter sp.]